MNMGYRPKYYDCTLDKITTEGSKNLFSLIWKETNTKIEKYVDQPSELILERMKEIVSGKRDKLYLTYGMRDIDVSYLGNNKWQLFDEFDLFEFEMAV